MTRVKTFEVGETKCLDDGSGNQGLLIGCANRAVISLMFDNKRATHAQVHELDRLLGRMGLQAVEVQSEEPRRVSIQTIRRGTRFRPGC